MNVQRVPVALFGPASPSECPTESHAHKHALKLLPKATSKFGQVHSPQRLRCTAQQWDARSGGPPAPAPALLATHSLRPCRSVSSASSTTLHGPTFGRDFSMRPRLVPSSDAAVARSAMVPYPVRSKTPDKKGLSCRATLAVYRGTGCGSHERHRSCRRRVCRRPSPCRSRGVRSEARRRLCCPCAPPDARGLQHAAGHRC